MGAEARCRSPQRTCAENLEKVGRGITPATFKGIVAFSVVRDLFIVGNIGDR